MKKLLAGTVLGIIFLGSCAQNKEKREEFKEAHDKDFMRNSMGSTAVAHSEPAVIPKDSTKVKNDSLKAK
ncbi:hypothetical protein [Chryseobacterium vaccae]|uniref:hypothetical protein n=1 Tax=Chryseobacterium vaccae TaxID=2604424 RepID=UPI001297CB4E|nr:hypothetical protein [Chryseobacterium vaccae]